jgi:hypothetical protein
MITNNKKKYRWRREKKDKGNGDRKLSHSELFMVLRTAVWETLF